MAQSPRVQKGGGVAVGQGFLGGAGTRSAPLGADESTLRALAKRDPRQNKREHRTGQDAWTYFVPASGLHIRSRGAVDL